MSLQYSETSAMDSIQNRKATSISQTRHSQIADSRITAKPPIQTQKCEAEPGSCTRSFNPSASHEKPELGCEECAPERADVVVEQQRLEGLEVGSRGLVRGASPSSERLGKERQSNAKRGKGRGGSRDLHFYEWCAISPVPPLKCLMRRRRGQWRRRMMMEEKLLAHARGEPGDMSHAVSGDSTDMSTEWLRCGPAARRIA